MTLAQYRHYQGQVQKQLAGDLGVSITSVASYESGVRIPCRVVMRRIHVLTEGLVTPNDFYKLEA